MSLFLSILIIDQDSSLKSLFQALLNQHFPKKQIDIYFVDNVENAKNLLNKKKFGLIFSDIKWLKALKPFSSHTPIVLMLEDEKQKNNMYDFVIKPFSPKEIKMVIDKFLSSSMIKNISQDSSFLFIGPSRLIENALDQIKKVSKYDSAVLLTGESGTGKEIVARMIHQKGLRAHQPFIAINCGAVPNHLMESELFGHKKGAFSGAVSDKKGLFESADQGTFFLDELGELPLSLQPKLLRVIQEGVFRPIGSVEEKKADVRIISATNRNLKKMVQNHLFREDLFHRLNVIHIHLPSLKQRKEDIPLLVKYFLEKNKKKYVKQNLCFSKSALESFKNYKYPGNIRELENIVERAVLLSETEVIEKKDLLPHFMEEDNVFSLEVPKEGLDLNQIMGRIEKYILSTAMDRFQGHRLKTAQLLHITPRSLKHRIKKYRLAK